MQLRKYLGICNWERTKPAPAESLRSPATAREGEALRTRRVSTPFPGGGPDQAPAAPNSASPRPGRPSSRRTPPVRAAAPLPIHFASPQALPSSPPPAPPSFQATRAPALPLPAAPAEGREGSRGGGGRALRGAPRPPHPPALVAPVPPLPPRAGAAPPRGGASRARRADKGPRPRGRRLSDAARGHSRSPRAWGRAPGPSGHPAAAAPLPSPPQRRSRAGPAPPPSTCGRRGARARQWAAAGGTGRDGAGRELALPLPVGAQPPGPRCGQGQGPRSGRSSPRLAAFPRKMPSPAGPALPPLPRRPSGADEPPEPPVRRGAAVAGAPRPPPGSRAGSEPPRRTPAPGDGTVPRPGGVRRCGNTPAPRRRESAAASAAATVRASAPPGQPPPAPRGTPQRVPQGVSLGEGGRGAPVPGGLGVPSVPPALQGARTSENKPPQHQHHHRSLETSGRNTSNYQFAPLVQLSH